MYEKTFPAVRPSRPLNGRAEQLKSLHSALPILKFCGRANGLRWKGEVATGGTQRCSKVMERRKKGRGRWGKLERNSLNIVRTNACH